MTENVRKEECALHHDGEETLAGARLSHPRGRPARARAQGSAEVLQKLPERPLSLL